MKTLEDYIRSIPDFPKPGIIFRDVTSLLEDADGFKLVTDSLIKCIEGQEVDLIAGTEARGFVFGAAMAYAMHKPFVLIRKKGKLPGKTLSASYDLEYGSASLEIHEDSIKPGQRVVIVDDLIATGGTIEAAAGLVEKLGGEIVKLLFIIELAGLKGRERLGKYNVEALLTYEGK